MQHLSHNGLVLVIPAPAPLHVLQQCIYINIRVAFQQVLQLRPVFQQRPKSRVTGDHLSEALHHVTHGVGEALPGCLAAFLREVLCHFEGHSVLCLGAAGSKGAPA
eukprot:Skav235172  [mRNA]  locus=scaffold721:184591:184908:+ [translate_table: standard]